MESIALKIVGVTVVCIILFLAVIGMICTFDSYIIPNVEPGFYEYLCPQFKVIVYIQKSVYLDGPFVFKSTSDDFCWIEELRQDMRSFNLGQSTVDFHNLDGRQTVIIEAPLYNTAFSVTVNTEKGKREFMVPPIFADPKKKWKKWEK